MRGAIDGVLAGVYAANYMNVIEIMKPEISNSIKASANNFPIFFNNDVLSASNAIS